MNKTAFNDLSINFGVHLTLDLYLCDKSRLNDMRLCFDALNNLPALIGMTLLTPPFVVHANSNEPEGGKDPGGYSGFVMIKESHISVHTFVERRFVSIDAYSCKPFDTDFVKNYFVELFDAKNMEVNVIERGKQYPLSNIE